MGVQMYSSLILNLGTRWRQVVSSILNIPQRKCHPSALNRGLGHQVWPDIPSIHLYSAE